MTVKNCTNPIKSHMDDFVKVIFVCPICKKKKEVVLPKNAINQTKGLSTLSIHKELVCEHTFQAYIDKNYKIRGYQKVDFELKSRNNIEKHNTQNLNENEKLLNNLLIEGNYLEYQPKNMNQKINNKDFHTDKNHHNKIHTNENISIMEGNKKLLKIKPKSLEEIYEDFKEFIDEENVYFKVFIQNDESRNKVFNANY
ncbi:MAG: hypothetical protein ACQERB_03645 [Promethearchaeati archaeon]